MKIWADVEPFRQFNLVGIWLIFGNYSTWANLFIFHLSLSFSWEPLILQVGHYKISNLEMNLQFDVELQEEVEAMAERIQKLHTKVIEHLTKTAESYKEEKDKKRREVRFQIGDLVMAHLKKKRFLAGTYEKLKDRQIGPCRIIAKYKPNAYNLDLPEGINISLVFNIADLKRYDALDGFHLTWQT